MCEYYLGGNRLSTVCRLRLNKFGSGLILVPYSGPTSSNDRKMTMSPRSHRRAPLTTKIWQDTWPYVEERLPK
jgi:hypothetical protein